MGMYLSRSIIVLWMSTAPIHKRSGGLSGDKDEEWDQHHHHQIPSLMEEVLLPSVLYAGGPTRGK